MSYYKSTCTDNADGYRATFYFDHSKPPVVVNVKEKDDVKRIEHMLDHCYNLGIAHEKVLQRACVAEWENKYVATVE